jgi:serine/threonine protein kinase
LVYLIRNYKITKAKINSLKRKSTLRGHTQESNFDPRDADVSPFVRVQGGNYEDSSSIGIFALKSMDKSLIDQCKKMDYVMNEKQILTSLSHPFIMKMHYSFNTKNYINLVLDF